MFSPASQQPEEIKKTKMLQDADRDLTSIDAKSRSSACYVMAQFAVSANDVKRITSGMIKRIERSLKQGGVEERYHASVVLGQLPNTEHGRSLVSGTTLAALKEGMKFSNADVRRNCSDAIMRVRQARPDLIPATSERPALTVAGKFATADNAN